MTHYIQAIARRLRQRPITFSNRPPAAPAAHYIQQLPAGCASGPLHSTREKQAALPFVDKAACFMLRRARRRAF